MTKPVSKLTSIRSGLGWGFVLSTILMILCKLWLNYYEGRVLPIGPGDRNLTLAVFNASALLSTCTLAGFLIATALIYAGANGPENTSKPPSALH